MLTQNNVSMFLHYEIQLSLGNQINLIQHITGIMTEYGQKNRESHLTPAGDKNKEAKCAGVIHLSSTEVSDLNIFRCAKF